MLHAYAQTEQVNRVMQIGWKVTFLKYLVFKQNYSAKKVPKHTTFFSWKPNRKQGKYMTGVERQIRGKVWEKLSLK